jgi:hypothetical protein
MHGAVLVSALFCVACIAPAQDSRVKVHGHWVGQSAADFLASEPGVKQGLDNCRAMVANPEAAVRADARYKPVQDGAVRDKSVKKLTDSFNADQAKDILRRLVTERGCDTLGPVFGDPRTGATGSGIIGRLRFDGNPYQHDPTQYNWVFKAGQLTKIMAFFPDGTYEEVLSDVSSRAKVKPLESASEKQNRYGARWQERSADWVTTQEQIELTYTGNPDEHEHVLLVVEPRSPFLPPAEVTATRSRPLD